jgi:predicted CXXCH cytochrome family protein
VYGSFLQSRMHAKGVRCSDCHEPHSTRTRAVGNALCVTCHNDTAPRAAAHVDTAGLKQKPYDSPAHHFHKPGKPGAQCVDCHAPAHTYMVVDPRRDHSFRIPRPDLSVALGTPNACNQCHDRKSAKWAAETVARWYGPDRRHERHYGEALYAGRYGKPGAVAGLIAVADDSTQPAIVRATALDLLSQFPGRSALASLQRGLKDTDPLVRRAAVAGQEQLAVEHRATAVLPLLDDPVRAVRMEAARVLVPAAATLQGSNAGKLNQVLAEFEAVQQENADRPEAHANLGNLYLARGDTGHAETAYRQAIKLDPGFAPGYVNLADLYRATGRNAEAMQVLREGLRITPNAAPLHEALGLALVREGQKAAALAEFAAAAKAAPENSRHAYIHAVALHDAGRPAEAMRILKAAVRKRGDREALLALASYALQMGNRAEAEEAIRVLASINPDDPALSRVRPRP